LIAAALIAAVGAVGLLTTLAISVFERQKEIGVMRSIGAGSTAIATQFLTEGVIVSLIAWVLAIPLSYVIALGLIAAFQMDSINCYPPSAWVIGLVVRQCRRTNSLGRHHAVHQLYRTFWYR
jgi:putative ABC transport system permease protein